VEKNAIAAAVKQWAAGQLAELLPVQAEVKANQLPAAAQLAEYRTSLTGLQQSPADDCVRILAGEGSSLKVSQERLYQLRAALDAGGLAVIRQARTVVNQMWPLLEARGQNEGLAETAASLKTSLPSETFYEAVAEIKAGAAAIEAAYRQQYSDLHRRRAERYEAALEKIKGQTDWPGVSEEMQDPLLSPLSSRACRDEALPPAEMSCSSCRATLDQMESDLAAVNGLVSRAIERVKEIVEPQVKTEKVHLAEFFPSSLDSPEAVDEALENLRNHLVKLLNEGVKVVLQ
jgi:hypothetical protein